VKFSRQPLAALLAGLFLFSCLGAALPDRSPAQTPEKSRPILYDFGMGRCLSCQQMEKILAAVKARYGSQVDIRLVYVDRDKDLAGQYKVMLIPTQVFLDPSGHEVFRHLGLFPQEELVKKLRELKFITN
jgi:thioredoxin 1